MERDQAPAAVPPHETDSSLRRFATGAWVALAAAVLIFSRAPDAFLNPQFWAEDGAVFYAQAFNDGALHALTVPRDGYFQTFSRLVAALSMAVPLSAAPALFNFCAIAVQLALAVFLVSSRMAAAISEVRGRLLLIALYFTLPASTEGLANVTNSHWQLALLAFLILVASPPSSLRGRIFDWVTVGLFALSGPLVIVLLAPAVVASWSRRERHTMQMTGLIAAGALVQVVTLVTTAGERLATSGGHQADYLFQVIGGRLFLGALLGTNGLTLLRDSLPGEWFVMIAFVAMCAGLAVAGYSAWRGPYALRLFLLFAMLVLCVTLTLMPWEGLAVIWNGRRFYSIPILAVNVTLVWAALRARSKVLRLIAITGLLVLPLGIVADWRRTTFEDLDFQRHARAFEKAPPGTEYSIPLNPKPIRMLLRK